MKNRGKIIFWAGLIALAAALVWSNWQPLLLSPAANRREIARPKQPITILAVGDINLGRRTGAELSKGNLDFPFVYVNDFLRETDLTFGNLESQLRETTVFQDPLNEYRFSGPLGGAESLAQAGFDILSVANNHMWDYGQEGLQSTLNALEAQAVVPVGASAAPDGRRFEPKILESRGWKIAFFALTDFINGYEKVGAADYIAHLDDLDQLLPRIESVREKTDLVIVSFHNGAEYAAKPTVRSIETAHQLVAAGADVVIGHHPHVVQPLEEYSSLSASLGANGSADKKAGERKGLIFYSLGNFAFWQPFSFWTKTGLAVKLTLHQSHTLSYELIPIEAGWQPKVTADSKTTRLVLERVRPSTL